MKRFKLKKWAPPGDNPNWSHDHCEICNKDLGKGDIAYSDDKNFYWVCKECFKKYKRN